MRHEDLNIQVESIINKMTSQLKKLATEGAAVRTGQAFCEYEQQIVFLCRVLAGQITGAVLGTIVRDEQWTSEIVSFFNVSKGLRSVGSRPAVIKTLSGVEVTVDTPYLAPQKNKKRSGRSSRRRRRSGSGIFPVLVALGIMEKCTPALLSEVSRQVVESSSVAEAQTSLARRGIELNIKTVWSITNAFAARSLSATEQLLANGANGSGEFANQRVVACVDGGRIRMRKKRRRGPIPKGKKRRRYHTPWREPKLLVIYVIDEQGKRDRRFLPFIDGTLGDADCVIALVIGYLKVLGVDRASELIISGDGAKWIWNRVNDIIEGIGIDAKKVWAIVDFFHAVEHLQAIAEHKAGWRKKQRKQWVTKQRRALRRGGIDKVIETIKPLISGRKAKKIRTELNYFIKNKNRMRYALYKKNCLPLGSGAVESSIRRVINLRMKGPSIFWREQNAEGFLHLRAQFKSGRWDEMVARTLAAHATPVAPLMPMAQGMQEAA